MTIEGPVLESLTRRLAECPAEFLAVPRIGQSGSVHVDAVVADLLRGLGGTAPTPELMAPFRENRPNWLRIVLITCWLLCDGWFSRDPRIAPRVLQLLTGGLQEMAAAVPAQQCVLDADRREELVRLCLAQLGLRVAGENEIQAQDRLTTLNSAERQRVIGAARAAEERAQAIREAMAKQAAEEAAAKYARE